jgi:hypothetical protein
MGVFLSGAALLLRRCILAADNSWNCRGRNNVPLSKKIQLQNYELDELKLTND